MPSDIVAYNAAQNAANKAVCKRLAEVISEELTKADSKLWHGSPVWFLDGNPIVGYAVRKDSVQLLFWSGQSFKDSGLQPEGTFKAAEMRYKDTRGIKVTALRGWLAQAKKIQWDYKNIVRRRGELVKIGTW
jgi:hypothetical protein